MTIYKLVLAVVAIVSYIFGYCTHLLVNIPANRKVATSVVTTTLVPPVQNRPQSRINESINLSILRKEIIADIGNPYLKPATGNVFLAFEIEILNKSNIDIYGGGFDSHSTFQIITSEGYTIEGENTSSDAWKKNRLVWNTEYLSPNDIGRGWIVFNLPQTSSPKYLIFKICKYNAPQSITGLSTLKIPLY